MNIIFNIQIFCIIDLFEFYQFGKQKVCTSPCSLEKEIKRLECENQDLKIKLHWVDTNMKEQKFLYNLMVVNYNRTMINCKAYEDRLKRKQVENAYIKMVAQRLVDEIEKLICYMEKRSVDSHINDNNDPINLLEVS